MMSNDSTVMRTLAASLILPVILFLEGCAPQSRLVKPATIDDLATLDWKAGTAGDINVTLSRVVIRDGPGSWVRGAAWDEYVLMLANAGAEPATVQSIQLASERLKDSSHTTDREALEIASHENLEAFKTAGLVLAVGLATVSTALTAAFVSAGWTVVTPAAPIAILVGGISAYRTLARRSEDRAVMDHQLERRGLRLPATLGSGTAIRGSAFFPITPAPTRLVVRYTVRDADRELVLDLKPLSGLHLAPPADAASHVPKAEVSRSD